MIDSVDGVFILLVAVLVTGLGVSKCNSEHSDIRRFNIENSFCAKGDRRGGGRLVRGNDGAFICIDPRAVKWERPELVAAP